MNTATTTGSTSTEAPARPAPAPRPGLRARWMKPAWSLHGWLGLAFAVPLLLVSLSGAVLVRYDWVERGFDRAVFRAAPAADALPLAPLLARLAAAHPHAQVRFLERPGDPARNLVVSLHGPGVRRALVVDAATGETLVDRDELSGPRRWLLRLHEELLAGGAGKVVVALSSLALLASSLTGLWLYRGAWRGLLRPPAVRGRGLRRLAGEWHKWLGFASLLLLLVWAVTGAWLTLPALPGAFAAERMPPLPAARYDWAAAPALEPMLERARREVPGAELDWLTLPREPGEAFVLTLLDRDRWFWNKFAEATFDGATGALQSVTRSADAPWLYKLNITVAVLHFGHLGGAGMKWLYLVFGFAPVVLAVSGVAIWWSRRRRRAGPAP